MVSTARDELRPRQRIRGCRRLKQNLGCCGLNGFVNCVDHRPPPWQILGQWHASCNPRAQCCLRDIWLPARISRMVGTELRWGSAFLRDGSGTRCPDRSKHGFSRCCGGGDNGGHYPPGFRPTPPPLHSPTPSAPAPLPPPPS